MNSRNLRAFGTRAVIAGLLLSFLAGCGDKPEALLASAKAYLAKQDTKAATIQLKNALQKEPNLAEARFLLGKTELEGGEVLSAEKELRRAVELGYAADQSVPLLAQSLLKQGKPDKVVKEFGQTQLVTSEAKADLLATVGSAHASLGKMDAAKTSLAASLQASPGGVRATLALAGVKAAENDLAAATKLVDEVLAKTPNSVDALTFKAGLFAVQNKSDEAVKVYEKVVELKPDDMRARFNIFTLLIRGQKLDAAAVQMEAMKKFAPKDMQTLYAQALVAFLKKDMRGATEAIQQVLSVAPEHLPSLLLAGSIELESGSFTQAEAHLQKVVERAPKHVAARRLLSLSYLRSGQASRAAEVIRPALELAPNSPDVLLTAGEVYLHTNQLDEAAKLYEKAAALEGSGAAARAGLAVTRLAMGDVDAGFRDLESASALDPKNYQADVTLVVAHLRRNEVDKALAAVDTLEKKQPNNPLTHNLRAAALLVKKDIPGARKSLARALELQPTFFPAAMTLAKLDFQEQKFDAAKKRLTDLLEKDPKNPDALTALSQLRAETGAAQKEVLEPLERAVAGNPKAVAPRLSLIELYKRFGDPKKALATAQDGFAALPESAQMLDALGQTQLAAGETNQALASFNKLAELRPKSAFPFLRLADAAMASKNSDGAIQALQKALAIEPANSDALRGLLGLLQAAGRGGEAASAVRRAQQQAPKSPVGWLMEGDFLASQKKWNDAASAYREGLKRFHTPDFVIRLNEALRQSGKAADADKVVADWQKDNPKDLTVRAFLAERAIRNKQFDVAVQGYKAMLELQPDNAAILNNLAFAASQLKDPKALEYAEKAYALQPNSVAIMDTLGLMLAERGNAARGVELLQKALAAAPEQHTIRLNLAKALVAAGKKDQAKRELETLIKLGDKFSGKDEAAALMKTL